LGIVFPFPLQFYFTLQQKFLAHNSAKPAAKVSILRIKEIAG